MYIIIRNIFEISFFPGFGADIHQDLHSASGTFLFSRFWIHGQDNFVIIGFDFLLPLWILVIWKRLLKGFPGGFHVFICRATWGTGTYSLTHFINFRLDATCTFKIFLYCGDFTSFFLYADLLVNCLLSSVSGCAQKICAFSK
jgi:hypothetical protein